MKRFLYGIILLVILCPVKLQAQKFLTPATDFGSPEYQDRLYRELLYDDHHQPFGERGHIFEAFYLALPDAHGNPNPTPPEYAFVVKDSMIVMKRAKSNINDALFAQNRIKYHYIKGYDAEQQQRMRKAAASLKSYQADVWTMSVSPNFCRCINDLFEVANLTAIYLECEDKSSIQEKSTVQMEKMTLGHHGYRYFGYWEKLSHLYASENGSRTGRLVLLADSICYAVEHHDTAVINRQHIICKALAKEFKQDIPVCYFTPWCNKSAGTRKPWQVQLFNSRVQGDFWLYFNVDRIADEAMIEEYRQLYADSVAIWTREAYMINPVRCPKITVEENNSAECYIYAEQYNAKYQEICEVCIPKALLRRDIFLSVLELPLGRYRLGAENRWVPLSVH